MVSGKNGIRAARAWLKKHSRRSPLTTDAVAAKSQNKIPRILSPVCALSLARARLGFLRDGCRFALYAAGRLRPKRLTPRGDRKRGRAVRPGETQSAALHHPGCHAR